MSLYIRARLPQDRFLAGSLWAEDDGKTIYGPVQCRGEADNTQAAAHDNVPEDPERSYGDHPAGLYKVGKVLQTVGSNENFNRYGPFFIRLIPESGECKVAADNGRGGFGIHGGALHSDGRLRETYGCNRVEDRAVVELAALILQKKDDPIWYLCEIEEEESDGPGA